MKRAKLPGALLKALNVVASDRSEVVLILEMNNWTVGVGFHRAIAGAA